MNKSLLAFGKSLGSLQTACLCLYIECDIQKWITEMATMLRLIDKSNITVARFYWLYGNQNPAFFQSKEKWAFYLGEKIDKGFVHIPSNLYNVAKQFIEFCLHKSMCRGRTPFKSSLSQSLAHSLSFSWIYLPPRLSLSSFLFASQWQCGCNVFRNFIYHTYYLEKQKKKKCSLFRVPNKSGEIKLEHEVE